MKSKELMGSRQCFRFRLSLIQHWYLDCIKPTSSRAARIMFPAMSR